MPIAHPNLIEIPMPILTPRLLLRPPQAGDGPQYNAAVNANIDHLGRFLLWADSPKTLEESESTARLHQANVLLRSEIVIAIFDRNTQQLLGSSGFHQIDWNLPKFEIGYWVRKDSEGRGIISETVNALTRYAFQQFKARRVEIRCETDNTRSRAVAERLGFHLDGILRQDRLKIQTQEPTDTFIYSRLQAEGLPQLQVTW